MARKLLLFFVYLCLPLSLFAQYNAADYTVQLTAQVSNTAPRITLHWQHDSHAVSHTVYRRVLGETSGWGSGRFVKGTDSTYADPTANPDTTYEYLVVESAKAGTSTWYARGFITSGVNVVPQTLLGTVILLVDKTYVSPLASEISRLQQDLRAEGWNIIRHDVNRTDSDTTIKAILQNDYEADPDHVRTLFILGHVPVPYSGDIAPDGHTPGNGNHQGAWPADCYYGNFDGDWTDETVNDVTAGDPRNRNIPGDGKFDADYIDAPMNLEVGRVDLYNMPAFLPLTDTMLMRQYLDRDHAFRTGAFTVPHRALIDINFPVFVYQGPSAPQDVPGEDAWRNFPPLVGLNALVDTANTPAFKAAQVNSGGWFTYLDTTEFLWAYGCGPGSYNSCGGIGYTSDFAAKGAKSVFNMVFGSFFGDWDHADDLTRAPLATNYGLASCWASRPFWYFHPLGMGQTLGYCTKLTQSDGSGGEVDYVYGYSIAGVHVALMGDPTLRMQYLSEPPTALSAQVNGSSVNLSWTAPKTSVPNYNVYRAASAAGPFTLVKTVTTASFTDTAPLNDSNIYIVRAASLITTPSGSYWNESGGVTQSVKVALQDVAANTPTPNALHASYNDGTLDISFTHNSGDAARISVTDIAGREVKSVAEVTYPGSYSYEVDTHSWANGIYFIRAIGVSGVQVQKVVIAR